MCTITSFQFDIYPLSYPGQGFSRLYGYIFQGILMKWLKSVNPDFASKLHKMKDEKGNNLKRKYSIQYKRIRKNSLDQYQKPGQQLEECLGKCKSSSLKKKTSESAQRVSVKGKCN